MAQCRYCDDTGHVCEDHPNQPWGPMSAAANACSCGGAGMPCRACCSPIPQDGSFSIGDAFTPRAAKH